MFLVSNPNFGPELTLQEVYQILRETRKSNSPQRAEFFLNNRIDLLASVERGYTITILDHCEFIIEYHDQGLIFVHPLKEHQYVPCGWFSIHWLQRGE